MPAEHTFYNYAGDLPKTRGPHIRHIQEDVGGARYIEIPERCPCQDDPRLAGRKPLLNKSHEEQFWRNLHTFTGLRAQDAAFEMDEKARRDENKKEKIRDALLYITGVEKGCGSV